MKLISALLATKFYEQFNKKQEFIDTVASFLSSLGMAAAAKVSGVQAVEGVH